MPAVNLHGKVESEEFQDYCNPEKPIEYHGIAEILADEC